MTTGLPVSSLIDVSVTLTPVAAQGTNFDSHLIIGDSTVIDAGQRIRTYTSLAAVAGDFGTTAPEYEAADWFFSQSPQPPSLMIGRWAHTATPATLNGAILTSAQQALGNFTTITNGGVDFTVNGAAQNLTGLNFDGVTNLNGVASALTTAFAGAATVTWNGSNFQVETNATGAGTAASATATFASNPAANDTLTINGVAITFVSSNVTGNEVLIGTNTAATVANLLAFLQASTNASLDILSYSLAGMVLTIADKTVGTSGNSITLSKSSTAITLSGSTLAGGIAPATLSYATTGGGEDISTLLGLTQALAQDVAQGINAESAVTALSIMDALATPFYGVSFATPDIADSDHLAIAAYVQGSSNPHMYWVSSAETANLVSGNTGSISAELKSGSYYRSFLQYSQTPYAVNSAAGRLYTTNFTESNTVITLAYKAELGINPENLTPAQAAQLVATNCNFFASYSNGTAILFPGVMCDGTDASAIQGTDALANAIQTNLFNLLYGTNTRVPQTDAGTQQLINVIEATLAQYVANGLIAPGTWTAASAFGTLVQGQYLPKGYYVYAPSVATQSPAAREAGQSVPIQIAIKLAGAIKTINVAITVNR